MLKQAIAIGAILLSGSAFAADIAAPPFEPGPVVVPFSWTGLHVGIQAGFGRGGSDYHQNDPVNFASTTLDAAFDPDGGTFGAFAGYDYQFSNGLVVGTEADLNWNGSKADHVQAIDGTGPVSQYGSTRIKWDGSVRGRIGYAFDQFMPYITGGVAVASVSHSFEDATGSPSVFYNGKSRYFGWTFGVGFQYAITENLAFRAEYRYSDYGSEHYAYDASLPTIGAHDVNMSSSTVRLGLSYRF